MEWTFVERVSGAEDVDRKLSDGFKQTMEISHIYHKLDTARPGFFCLTNH
jgi:hypothetical protein